MMVSKGFRRSRVRFESLGVQETDKREEGGRGLYLVVGIVSEGWAT